jgi:hypothetical protein
MRAAQSPTTICDGPLLAWLKYGQGIDVRRPLPSDRLLN